MVKEFIHIAVLKEDYDKLLESKKRWIKHHPEDDGKNITNYFIFRKMQDYWLRTP